MAFSASHVVAFGATHELAATQSRVRLVVDNPTPGALLPPVPVQLNGSATDPGAQSGTSGVDRVQVFVNDPNSTDKLLVSDAQVAPDGTWTATANLAGRWGSGNLYVVAHSSVDGGETTVNIPVMFLW
ncbi:MAG: hypothetical protein JO057_21515 [Chloroflexi bacterium]|nr:hypothetical protein [Chloroflexota bacterium]